ncbi:formate--tetrahydrofolate ligase [Aliivibrio kagoshimensis]|uniref:formate--tetrahydrofolate ligase n=1 Tax=Aliivibrio kagoshimensis TaxID=2910230 RepID=UPI003D0B21BD
MVFISDLDISQNTPLSRVEKIALNAGLSADEFTPQGKFKAKVSLDVIDRLKHKKNGKLVLVTAITPTPLGEGKTVTTIGLAQGLAKQKQSAIACIRQPSMGPVFGIKGGAAGGGYSQVAPMEELNLHLTGDIHAVTSAHNLASAAIDARIYHEQKHGYDAFSAKTGLNALQIDTKQVTWRRVIDHNDRALRMVTVGKNAPSKTINGYEREEGYDITAASELMAILSLATDLQDLRKRIGKIVIGFNLDGQPVTTEDLQVAGAMTVIMKSAIEPTLMQTLEGVPTLIHSGPFANIAHGNSSIIADKVALKLADYTVTEGGFGSDMGFEKACNIKAQYAGSGPDCAVLVATLRGLKANSGKYDLAPGQPFPTSISDPDEAALIAGFENLKWHIDNVHKYGVPVVVAINRFPQDSSEELEQLNAMINDIDAPYSINVATSDAFCKGGEGAIDLANQVITACEQPSNFKPIYQLDQSLEEKIMAISEIGYGATNVTLSEQATAQLNKFTALGFSHLALCMAKTPLSITSDPSVKGAPTDFTLPIRELKLCAGAGFIYALCGEVMTMPGLSEKPAFMNLDIDQQGNIIGLS